MICLSLTVLVTLTTVGDSLILMVMASDTVSWTVGDSWMVMTLASDTVSWTVMILASGPVLDAGSEL